MSRFCLFDIKLEVETWQHFQTEVISATVLKSAINMEGIKMLSFFLNLGILAHTSKSER